MNNVINKKAKRLICHSSFKKYYCAVALLLLSTAVANAQTKPATTKTAPAIKAAPTPAPVAAKVAATAPVGDLKPAAYNIVDYQSTPQHAARKAKYSSSLSKPHTKTMSFADNTKITITYSKTVPKNLVAGAVEKTKKSTKKTSSNGLVCTETTVSLDANSDNFLSNDQAGAAANIYPGAVYTIDNLTNGTYQQQTGARNTMVITTNNPNTSLSSVTVQNPNMGTLNSAIAKLYAAFKGKSGEESFAYQVTTATNSAVYNLAIGASASGYGVDLSNVYSTGNQSNHVHLTIDATKTLFSISALPPDNGIFKDPSIEANPDMTYIGQVSYGVKVLANADITFSSQSDADAFKAAYSGFGFSASLNLDYSSGSKSSSSTINGYVVGGPGNQIVAYSLSELKTLINKAFAATTYANARPISYQAMSMDDQVVHNGNLTSDFTEQNCVAADGGAPEIQDIEVTFQEGPDGKDAKTPFNVVMVPGITGNNENIIFDYAMPANTQQFANNASNMVVLTPNKKGYKGRFDATAFAKAGGGRLIICVYPPASGYDIWQISGVTVTVILKPSSGSSTGAGPPPPMKWTMSGANMFNLDTRQSSTNTATLSFDGTMTASGPYAQQ